MKPTEEQEHAVRLAQKGCDLKLAAFAGAGKTTTLKLIAKNISNKRGVYIAFNKAIVNSLEGSLPSNVTARTFHSLAYAKFGVPLRHKLNSRLTGTYVAKRLGIQSSTIETEIGGRRIINPATIGYYVMQCAQAYARWNGHDMPVNAYPYPDIRNLSGGQLAAFRRDYSGLAIKLWGLMSDISDDCPSTHDVYVKKWVESNPQLPYDFILFDECQDADLLMIRLVSNQSSQKIWVGDEYQSIYAWRGAKNAMEIIQGDTAYLTQSFRFGEAIAERAQLLLWTLGCRQRIRGLQSKVSSVERLRDCDAMIFRTNAGVIGELIERNIAGNGNGISATGIDSALKRLNAIKQLRDGVKAGGEFALFDSYSELVEYANTLSGSDMLPLVKIEKDYGADKVIDLLERAGRVRDPSLTLSVGHQAKGLEWGRVRIGEDFAMPSTEAARQQSLDSGDPPPREPTEEENRLLYVCLTRAMDILDDSNVEYRGYFERLGDLPPPSGRKFASAIDEAESMLDEGCSKSELRGRVVHAISDVASPERRELLANVASDIVLSEAKLRDGAHTFA